MGLVLDGFQMDVDRIVSLVLVVLVRRSVLPGSTVAVRAPAVWLWFVEEFVVVGVVGTFQWLMTIALLSILRASLVDDVEEASVTWVPSVGGFADG